MSSEFLTVADGYDPTNDRINATMKHADYHEAVSAANKVVVNGSIATVYICRVVAVVTRAAHIKEFP